MPTALHRRRRVLLALVVLNVVELTGVFVVGPGFWIGFSVSFAVFCAYLVYLRRRAVVAGRQRQALARRAQWVARQQAAVRREHQRRAEQRHAAARQAAAARDLARRRAVELAAEYTQRWRPTAGGP